MARTKKTSAAKEGKKRTYIPITAIVIIVVLAGIFWYREYSRYIKSDDAYIDAHTVALGSKTMGRIARINVDEGDTVKAGTLIIELDSAELMAQLNQAFALKNQMLSNKQQSVAKLDFDQKSVVVQEINYKKAQDDFNRAKIQYDGGVITNEQYDHARKNLEIAKAQRDAAVSSLNVSRSQVASSQSAVENADSQISLIDTMLNNTQIHAPIDAIVAKKWLREGDVAQPGQTIITLTEISKKWVSVFIEETEIHNLYLGQKAFFTVDAYPGLKAYGKLYYIGSNTSSQFSLIPPNNASGNFTKITQRVPLKISIDSISDRHLNRERIDFISGMSAVVKIVK